MHKFDKFMWWLTEGGWVLIFMFCLFMLMTYHSYDYLIQRKWCESINGTYIQGHCFDKAMIKR